MTNLNNAPEVVVIEETGKFVSLNMILDHEKMDFVGYEFEGKEIFIDDIEDEQSLFRVNVYKETGEIIVNSAYSEDFDVMEEVTEYFDTEKLLADIKAYMEKNEVGNQGEVYVKYCELREEGYECDDAVYLAYEAVNN